jgi:hypothetical protein
MRKFVIALIAVFVLLLLISAAGSCRPVRSTVTESSIKKDSSSITIGNELYIDTVTVPGDSLEYEFQLQVDENGNIKPASIKSGSGRISFAAKIDSLNVLRLRLDCNEYKLEMQRYRTLANSYKLLADTNQRTVEKPILIYRIPFYIYVVIAAMGLIIIILLVTKYFPQFFKNLLS